MNPKKSILISLLIIVVLVVGFYFVTYGVTQFTGRTVSDDSTGFEKCLMSKKLILYINTINSDIELKNTGLIDYLQYFKIQNCFINSIPCSNNNIEIFPTWIIEGKQVVGKLTVSELAEYSGC